MRLLAAGVALLIIGIGLTEYGRRNPSVPTGEETTSTDGGVARPKQKRSAEAERLLATAPAGEPPRFDPSALSAVTAPAAPTPQNGFQPIAEGTFVSRELRGGFGVALFIAEQEGHFGIVRAAPGEAPAVLIAGTERIDAMAVDGSTLFFSVNGVVLSTFTRGEPELTVRARFTNAIVTSIAAAGDTMVLTLISKDDRDDDDATGAVVSVDSAGEVTLIAHPQTNPRGAQTDGKDAYWVADETLWRGGLTGSFSSKLSDPATEPMVLDGDAVYFRAPVGTGTELRKVGRAGGKQQTVLTAEVGSLTVASGLARVATTGSGAALLEVTPGNEGSKVWELPGSPRGLALGGTTLFIATQKEDGRTTLWAK